MRARTPVYVAAAVQAAPVFLDRTATVDKVCSLVGTAAKAGAKLVVFPEAFVSAYPEWVWRLPVGERAEHEALYGEMVESAVEVPGEVTRRLGQAARAAGALVGIGVNERNRGTGGTSLYNSFLLFGADGALLGCHRKLVPTSSERLVWAPGDGSTLRVHDTPLGRIGGLICWENYMPLARYALYAEGEQVHLSPTWDHGEPWLATLRHIAREGRVFVVSACQAFRRDDIPSRFGFRRLYPKDRVWINPGESAIVNPAGQVLAGPVREREGILYAEIDPSKVAGSRWMLDVTGHYARPDVFRFAVRRRPGADEAEGGDGEDHPRARGARGRTSAREGAPPRETAARRARRT